VERADLLITDVVMPEMTGTELASTLAQEIPGMKVLYMSGHSGDPVIEVELNSGREVFLQKPFGRDVLIRKVREVLDSHQGETASS
jgi:FixJ family two-component response regulator